MSIFNTKYEIRYTRYEKGAVLLFTLMVMITLISVVGAYLGFVQSSIRSTGAQIEDSQAIYLADAGLDMAIWYLRNTAPDGSGDCSWRTTAYPAVPGPDPNDPQQKSLGNGTFTIWVQDSGSDIWVHARGTVGGLSRVITETLTLTSSTLERAVHADGAHLNLTNSSGTINGNVSCFISVEPDPLPAGMTITGTVTDRDDGQDKVNPAITFSVYYDLANDLGQLVATKGGNKTFDSSGSPYTGIWYMTGKATIESNVTINGSIIAEGTIDFKNSGNRNAENVIINPKAYAPAQNYPALVSGSRITGTVKSGVGLKDSTISGLILADNNITFDSLSGTTFNGTILAGNNISMQNASSFTVNYDADIFSPMPPGFTFSGGDYTVIPQGDWNEI